ncbi:MFS transporter [Chloroflexota bacterium]
MTPLKWKPRRLFFGWWVVGASFVITFYTGGIVFYGFTAVFEPIADEMGWSYTQISLAASLRGLEMGILAPLTGILVDRWGPRRLVFIGALFTAVGLVFLSQTTSIGMFYGAFILIAIGVSCCTLTVLLTAVANWFREKIGIASGIALTGFGFSGLMIPLIVKLIDTYDWRNTMTILAIGMLVTVLPLSLILRHKPEQYGYLPDGRTEGPAVLDNGSVLTQVTEVEIKIKQALKSSTFWRMVLAFACHVTLVTAIITHVMPYLSSIGISRAKASLVATAIPLMSIGGRLGLGWLGDKIDRRKVSAVAFAMMGIGEFCFGYASTGKTWLLIPFLILFGLGYGGVNSMRPSLGREYFGRSSFGTIFGFLVGISTLGTIAGPFLAGWAYDNWGSYQGMWLIFVSLPLAAAISILTIHPVKTKAKTVDKNLTLIQD